MSSLRIDHLNTFYGGGAAIAARRVHDSLRAAGQQSTFWYIHGQAGENEGCRRWTPQPIRGWSAWLQQLKKPFHHAAFRKSIRSALRGRKRGQKLFSPSRLPHRFAWTAETFRAADVLHLHWLGTAIDYPSFFRSVRPDQPIVWTLHDMNAFTGGCHYDSGCGRYLQGCGHCPQLGRPAADDLSQQTFQTKIESLPLEQIHVVAPSRWLLAAAESSPILGRAASFQCIPYGLDLERFSPRDRDAARRRLGLPADRRIIAFGADEVGIYRKGVRELCEALRQLASEPNLTCAYFGRGELPLDAEESPELFRLGFIDDADRLVDIYSAADVFVMPSLEDNLPQTGIEAIACGTQVAAFDVGGVPDFVRPGRSGALAPLGDSAALANEIVSLLSPQYDRSQRTSAAESMRASARGVAEALFDPQRQADSYLALYDRILAGGSQRNAA